MTDSAPAAVQRFTLAQRLNHLFLIITFTGLAITGLPQKYAAQDWAEAMIGVMGGIEFVRILHRVCATGLMVVSIVHVLDVFYRMFVVSHPPGMLPTLGDLRDVVGMLGYNLGLRKQRPKMPRYNYEEKFEYWALVWGTVVMILTGFMMWNPIATTRFLPGEAIPAAKAAHGNEALLAVAAIIIWHMYNVHIRHFNKSMFTGKLDRHAMEEDHALELEAIDAGKVPAVPSAEVYRKRMRVFVPVALVVAILLTAALVWFVTFEQTAITTIPIN
jgi:formate dehydrogenase gamma subunit